MTAGEFKAWYEELTIEHFHIHPRAARKKPFQISIVMRWTEGRHWGDGMNLVVLQIREDLAPGISQYFRQLCSEHYDSEIFYEGLMPTHRYDNDVIEQPWKSQIGAVPLMKSRTFAEFLRFNLAGKTG